MRLVVMQVVLWNAADFFSIFLSFLYSMPLWKVGAKFVKKQCINDPKKSYCSLCFTVFYAHCPSKPLNARKQ